MTTIHRTKPTARNSPDDEHEPSAGRADRAGMQYARIPHTLAESLSGGALRLLSTLLRLLWRRADWTDTDLAVEIGRSPGNVQRYLRELEGQGAITRRRYRGRRTITIAFSLAGATKSTSSKDAPIERPARNRCTTQRAIGASAGRSIGVSPQRSMGADPYP